MPPTPPTPAASPLAPALLPRGQAVRVFAVLALGYFLSSLLRGVTGTLAPVLTREFALSAGQLGLLAGGYFLGFAVMQLPLGRWLDRHGPKRVLLWLLVAAVCSALAFAAAQGLGSLLLARMLGGVGVCACLMAPLTGYRRWLAPEVQQRANAWMLMAGSCGLLAATLPVQWLLPVMDWRWLFVALAGLFLLAMAGIARALPAGPAQATHVTTAGDGSATLRESYRPVFTHPYFRRCAPLALVNYAALLSVQTLWAGPWLTGVAGCTPDQAALGLFCINLTMLCVYWLWGVAATWLARSRWSAERLLVWATPWSAVCLAAVAWAGPAAGWPALALFCALSSVLALAQPAVGLAFDTAVAGRALSAYNLVMFLGTFLVQWGLGVGVDALQAQGLARALALRWMFGLLAAGCLAAWGVFAAAGARAGWPEARPPRGDQR